MCAVLIVLDEMESACGTCGVEVWCVCMGEEERRKLWRGGGASFTWDFGEEEPEEVDWSWWVLPKI